MRKITLMINHQHIAQLQASMISVERAAARGYESVDDPQRLRALGFSRTQAVLVPALLIPQRDKRGEVWGYMSRPDEPGAGRQKYETRSGQPNHLDVPPGVGERLDDPTVPLMITEGSKKADAGAEAGLCIVSINGVYGWRGKNAHGAKTALADWEEIALDGREVVLAFDSDVVVKRPVQQALGRFAQFLANRGADVSYLHLPHNGDGKTGLDDYLAAGHTVDELHALIRPEPPALQQADAAPEDHYEDAYLAKAVADRTLHGRYVWNGADGWLRYDSGVWWRVPEEHVAERVRLDLVAWFEAETKGANYYKIKALARVLATGRIRAITSLCRGILEVAAEKLDADPDLLNCANGTLHLPSGQLYDHDPERYLTKIANVAYIPGAKHSDWDNALEALPAPVRDWLQLRIGQAATGYRTPDDILPVCVGGGQNGKSTVLGGVQKALGDYAVVIPEKAIMAQPGDHSTELMTLRGARFALIEETPEARHFNIKRLKDMVGTPYVTARHIRRDNVTFETTHSLFLTSNYRPRIDEVDHGTWRRLALVRFPYTFLKPGQTSANPMAIPGIPGLRERVREGRGGQHEAVLAWIIDGARAWYAADRILPPAPDDIVKDTAEWRASADLIFGFIDEILVFELDTHVVAKELFESCNEWLRARGHNSWSEQTFAERFGGHSIVQAHHVRKERVYVTRERLSVGTVALTSCPSGSTLGAASASGGRVTLKMI
jgi:putative DNA primase/helicase